MLVLGIDLTASPKRYSAYALLDDQVRLAQLGQFREFDELLAALDGIEHSLVGIDAPLSLPLGLDCLEEDHPCSPVSGHKGRAAERELARIGIGCFFTTKRSIIKGLTYRGMELCRDFVARGYDVLEVYPYASKVVLFGRWIPRKSTPSGLAFLVERLATLIGGLEPYLDRLNHDECDALIAAYTAKLHLERRTDCLGTKEEGYIVVPHPLGEVLV